MRILFHHRIGSRDGQSVHLEELMKALTALGHEVILVGPAAFAETNFGGSNGLVDRIKALIPAWLYEPLEIVYNVKAFLRLRAAVREHKPDIIYERFSLYLFAGVWLRRVTGLPLMLEVNSPLFEERAKNDGLKLRRIGRWAQGYIWRNVDHLFPVTAVLARTIAEYGVPESRVTVISNGVDPARFPLPAEKSRAPETGQKPRIVLGFTGFIRGWNAVDRLIDFAARHRATYDIHVLVVGDGPARPELEARAKELDMTDKLTITGIVGRDAVTEYVSGFDIAVLPDVTPYSSPLKLFEYLQLGSAIVGPDMANIREILTDGENALLFSRDGANNLEAALLKLCADAGLRARLGRAAHGTIATRSLTWKDCAARVIAVADGLLRQAGSAAKGDS
ncbi:MAG: glycosyltransferase family 4 protein [Alphaproteobacteria bacterium]|nr:glycosyltransferase family 4 protein [Alphaproteobacteria bacterium]